MEFKSAIWKLTGFYVVIAMAISIIFSLVLYQFSARELNTALSRQNRQIQRMPIMGVQIGPERFRVFENTRLEQLEASSNRLKLDLLGFNILILFLSGGASYFLAKRTLHPIAEMVDKQNRFTADASHELRTPLTAMKTEIEVSLRDKQLNLEDAKKLLGSNLEEISKLESLSNNLLSLAQYQGIKEIPKVEVDFKAVVEESYEKVKALAKNRDISFTFDLGGAKVMGDRQSLTQLSVILLDNAIKYSPKKSKVSVSLAEEHGHAVFKVADQGAGIKQSDLPHIFSRFYRADISRSKGGTGLGLSIAKQITGVHRGTIHADSNKNGSVFTVKLPVSK